MPPCQLDRFLLTMPLTCAKRMQAKVVQQICTVTALMSGARHLPAFALDLSLILSTGRGAADVKAAGL